METRQTGLTGAARKDIRDVIQSQKDEIARALPKHMDADRMIRVMLTAINTTPKLLNCSRESLLGALMKCSQYGLEPDGRHAHLIPYGEDCQLIFDYKGLCTLVRRSGDVSDIHCDVVYAKDHFEFGFGTGGGLVHKPNLQDENRGEITCAYSFVKLKDGSTSYEVMPRWEIEKVKESSAGYKAAKKYNKPSVWENHWNEMAKKTVFRRHTKWLPLSFEVAEAIHADDDGLTNEQRFARAKQVNASDTMVEGSLPAQLPESPATTTEQPKDALQAELVALISAEGFTFQELCLWAKAGGHIEDTNLTPETFPEEVAKRLIRAKVGMLRGLADFKAEVAA